jgi:ATP-dependent Lon protease
MISGRLPVLALRGLAVFPDQTVHFDVGRTKSVKALEEAMKRDQNIMLIPQRDIVDQDPALEGLYAIGTVAKIKQILHAQGDNLRVLVTGICRARISDLYQTEPYLAGNIIAVPETEVMDTTRAHALRREANNLYGLYCNLLEHPAQNVQLRMLQTENSGFIADSIAQHSGIDYPDKV